jgi:hypothetical protein
MPRCQMGLRDAPMALVGRYGKRLRRALNAMPAMICRRQDAARLRWEEAALSLNSEGRSVSAVASERSSIERVA